MAGFITALTGENGINADALWGAVTPIIPLVVVLVIFAFSYRIIKKATKAGAKGKVNM